VGGRRLGALLRLADDAIGLGWDFGLGSVEALAWVARTVETAVYVPDSLVRTASGFRFALANPPLRIGAFSCVLVRVDGTPVPPDRVRVRHRPVGAWRTTSEIGTAQPLLLQAGNATEFDADWPVAPGSAPLLIRLELQNVAIPPLVWMEFREIPGEDPSP
jgi:hypothetical protein